MADSSVEPKTKTQESNEQKEFNDFSNNKKNATKLFENIINSYFFDPIYPPRYMFCEYLKKKSEKKKKSDEKVKSELLGVKCERKFFDITKRIIKDDFPNKEEYFLLQLDGIKSNGIFNKKESPDYVLFYKEYIVLVECKSKDLSISISQINSFKDLVLRIEKFKNLKFCSIVFYDSDLRNEIIQSFEKSNPGVKLLQSKEYESWTNEEYDNCLKGCAMNNKDDLKEFKLFLIWKYIKKNSQNMDTYEKSFDNLTEKLIKGSFKEEYLNENFLILNGPAGTGKTVLLVDKLAQTIKQSKTYKSCLTLVYSCLNEKISQVVKKVIHDLTIDENTNLKDFIFKSKNESQIKELNSKLKLNKLNKNYKVIEDKDFLKKWNLKPMSIPRFYSYYESKPNELRSIDFKKTNYNRIIIILDGDNSFLLIKDINGNKQCNDIFLAGFPSSYSFLFEILKMIKFDELKEKLFVIFDSPKELYYLVTLLITYIKHQCLLNLLTSDKKSDLETLFNEYKQTESNISKSQNMEELFVNFCNFENNIDSFVNSINGSEILNDLLKHYRLNIVEDFIKKIKIQISDKKDIYDLRWVIFNEISQKSENFLRKYPIIIKEIEKLDNIYNTQDDQYKMKILNILETDILNDPFACKSICNELFRNVIFVTFRFILDHTHKLTQNYKITSENLNIFIDDGVGIINQDNRHSEAKFPIEYISKLRNVWMTFDLHQLFAFNLEKNEPIIPDLNTECRIIYLDTIYRCSKEIFKIYRYFYDHSLMSIQDCFSNKTSSLIHFNCFKCFENEAENKNNSKINLNTNIIDFLTQINELDRSRQIKISDYSCFYSGEFKSIPCKKIDELMKTVEGLIQEYTAIFNNDEIAIIFDDNYHVNSAFIADNELKNKVYRKIKRTNTLFSNLKNYLDENYKAIELFKLGSSKSYFSKEYSFVIYVIPGIFGYFRNFHRDKNLSNRFESFRFDSYFAISRATSICMIVYLECEGRSFFVTILISFLFL